VGGKARGDAARPLPVSAAPAGAGKLDVTLTALGTVVPVATVTVHPRVDGLLQRVLFTEGQHVRAGDVIAQIDPVPFQVQVDSAAASLQRDQALLRNAEVDLARYRGLLAQDSVPSQQVDNQAELVKQYQGLAAYDQAQLDNAKLQLAYTHVTAPSSGQAGLRQVDAGNMVHATDAGGIVVITQEKPITVVFPIPQDQLPPVLARLRAGAHPRVEAFDRDGRKPLAAGVLLTADNQIDTTTGTVKLKAQFPNENGILFPNQFVNVKLLVDTLVDALTIPSAAVQRGAPGLYVYAVGDDMTVSVRPVLLGTTSGDRVQVLAGVKAGDKVVTDGTDKLREGAKVELIDPNAAAGATAPRGTARRP